tara:strand:- start:1967 stop:2656 length:690 start_codon:yes stop_codon:yes gene_type:complete
MKVIGHRGAPSLKHENTLDSFKIALEHNVDGIELDVQLSQDNKLVIFHDFHTYSLNNKHDLIKNKSFFELQQLSSQFTIVTLEDILKIFPLKKELHIEIKSNELFNKNIINQIYHLVVKYQLINQTVFSSFNPFVLLELKNLFSDVKIGLLWTKCPYEPWFITHYSYDKILPQSFHASIEYITPNIGEWVKRKNMKLYCYTVNNTDQLKKAQLLKAEGIFSDYPNILKQ